MTSSDSLDHDGLVGDIGLSVLVLILVLIEFVMAPLEGLGRINQQMISLASGLGLGVGGLLVMRHRVTQVAIVVLMAIGVAFNLRSGPAVTPFRVAEIALHFVLLFMLTAAVSFAVFAPGRVNLHRILGSIAIYLLVALVFSNAYTLIRDFQAHAFTVATSWNALYFSFATMTTAGYGDVVPVYPVARSLANLQSVFGQLYPATIIARLVTLGIGQAR